MPKKQKASGPVLLAVNICDQVIRDETSKKISLIGLFNQIHATTFPARHPLLHVYVSLINGHKEYEGELRFVNEKDNSIVFSTKGKVPLQNPLQCAELNFAVKNLQFDTPGKYRVEFLCDGSPVGGREFIVSGPPPMSETKGG